MRPKFTWYPAKCPELVVLESSAKPSFGCRTELTEHSTTTDLISELTDSNENQSPQNVSAYYL